MSKQRYKVGDSWEIKVKLEIVGEDNGWGYDVECEKLGYAEALSGDELDDLVNPAAKRIRLLKEIEERQKMLEDMEWP